MNRKNVRSTKGQYKAVIFWGVLVLITIAFVIGVIIKFSTNMKITDYDKITHVSGQEIYTKGVESKTYLVFMYDSSKKDEEFDKQMFNYFTFVKNNKDKDGVYAIYCMDVTTTENKKCINSAIDKDVITSTTTFPTNGIDGNSSSSVIQVRPTSIPTLLVISESKVSSSYTGSNNISEYLQNIIDTNK